mmetsp:Transcript_14305/g.56976  ORF Transcript_14305/g.56976 Transcript_14305/m.56976 type:complete len:240 (+) Transcript_14305:184-903(+)
MARGARRRIRWHRRRRCCVTPRAPDGRGLPARPPHLDGRVDGAASQRRLAHHSARARAPDPRRVRRGLRVPHRRRRSPRPHALAPRRRTQPAPAQRVAPGGRRVRRRRRDGTARRARARAMGCLSRLESADGSRRAARDDRGRRAARVRGGDGVEGGIRSRRRDPPLAPSALRQVGPLLPVRPQSRWCDSWGPGRAARAKAPGRRARRRAMGALRRVRRHQPPRRRVAGHVRPLPRRRL